MLEPTETNRDNSSQNPSYYNTILTDFIFWFYSIAPKNIIEIWSGYLAANIHYFSIPLLFQTLFAHWHRDVESYGRGFDFARYARVFTLNMISRGVGFVMRTTIILFGLTLELVILVFGLLFLFFWLLAPLLLVIAFVFGIAKLL